MAARHQSAQPGSRADPIVVRREGTGPVVLLVHGGASPTTTWEGLSSLSRRWTLAFAYRRGYPPSPTPRDGRKDFEIDAADLAPLLDERPHLVAHSYGALGALIAAASRPDHVRSLTIIEPALFIPRDDPEVARFRQLGDTVMTHGMATDPILLRRFLRIAGAPVPDTGPLPDNVIRGVLRSHGTRSPSEADPDLEALRDAAIPTLVASGDHFLAIERMCDGLAAALDAERVVAPGAGHFVAGAPGFAGRLERFLLSAQSGGASSAERA
jgi:pimeloyl-ACP methyl ester carboxylesterase